MTTCMMPPIMYAWDGCILCVCVGVVYMSVFIVQVSQAWNNVFIGMTFLPNVLPPPKKARPSRCPSNQENAPLPNMALLPIGENMGKSRHIVHSWSVGSTIYVHPALQHFLLAFSGPIILSNTNCLYENLGEHDMDIACSAQRFGLGIFCPKVLAVFKTTCDWCLWLVNYVYVLAASNQTQISIYIKELSEKMVFSRHSVLHVGVAVGLRIWRGEMI